jgi:hypothetical protein
MKRMASGLLDASLFSYNGLFKAEVVYEGYRPNPLEANDMTQPQMNPTQPTPAKRREKIP